MRIAIFIMALVLLVIAGCAISPSYSGASNNNQPLDPPTSLAVTDPGGSANNDLSFEQQVMDRPLPTTEAQRISECNWIRYNIARQISAARLAGELMSDPVLSVATEAVARHV